MLWSALPQFVLLYRLSVCTINFQPHANPHSLSRSRPLFKNPMGVLSVENFWGPHGGVVPGGGGGIRVDCRDTTCCLCEPPAEHMKQAAMAAFFQPRASALALPLARGVDFQATVCDLERQSPIGCSACFVCSFGRQRGVVLWCGISGALEGAWAGGFALFGAKIGNCATNSGVMHNRWGGRQVGDFRQ